MLKFAPVVLGAFAAFTILNASPESPKPEKPVVVKTKDLQVKSALEKGHVTKSGLIKKRYRCELCDIDITNKKNLEKHKAGKKHLEKLQ